MKKRAFSIIAICLVLSILPAAARAGVIYVDGDVASSGTGESWGEAHKTITEALALAASGDEIWVKLGTYTESITMISGVALYGGFDGSESIRSDRDWEANITTIDASTAAAGTSAEHVVIMVRITNARVDGFTITGGNAAGSGGGGIYCSSSSSSSIINCTISGNSARYGGGIDCYSSSPSIINCTISGNSASNGGGGGCVFNSSSPSLINCTISGNSARYGGGGINCYSSSPSLINCIISGNSTEYMGGGVCCDHNSSPSLINCIISGNSAEYEGGGIYCDDNSDPGLINCTISGNSAGNYGGGICCSSSSPSLINCTISGNSAGYCGGGICFNSSSSPTIKNSIFTKNNEYAIYELSTDSDPEVTFCLFHDNPDGDYYYEGTTSYTGADEINTNVDGASDNIDGDPLFVVGASGTWISSPEPVYDSETNQTTLTDDSGTYQTNELAGRLINPDTSQNQEALIVSNTATTIVVVGDVTSFVSGGDDYEIMDYHIQSASDAKDQGTSIGAPDVDFDGDPRPFNTDYDIGADEYDDSTPTVSSVQVQSGLEVEVTFSKGLDRGVLTPGNYTVSGSGQGSLPAHPANVTYQEANTYRLTWDSGQSYEMVKGGDITVTVANVQDHLGYSIGSPNSGTHTGGGIGTFPTADAITPLTSSPTNADTVSFTVEFSEDVTGFDNVDDLVVNNATGVTFNGASFSGGPSQYTVNILNVAGDGDISLAADASSGVTDIAGNPLESSVTSAVVAIDNTVAVPTITGISTDSGTSGDGVTSDNTLELSGTAEAGSTVEVFRDSSSLGTATADGTGVWAFDYTGTALADGDYTFTAQATDLAGNVSSKSSGFEVTVDTTVQTPTNLDLAAADDSGTSNTDNITQNTSNLTISGTGEERAAIQLYNGGTAISGATATVSGGTFSIDVTLAANKTHTLTAIQTDPADNESAASSALNITVDTAALAPTNLDLAAADDSGTSNSDNITQNTSNLTISGSGEEDSTVRLYDNGYEISGVTATVLGGTFSLDVSLSANQTHALTARQTDPAGNISSASANLDITVDTAVPSISITAPADGLSGESLDAIIGSSSDSLAGVSSVELRITDGSQYIDQDQAHVSTPTWVTASGTDSWSFTTSLVSWKNVTTYTITARATDQAGNIGQSESHTWTNTTRDTVEQPVFSPPPGKYRHRQQVTATCDTAGATIYCTTDGSEPTETAPACGEEPVTIDRTIILKAKAFKSGWDPSATTEGLYEISKGLPWILPLLE